VSESYSSTSSHHSPLATLLKKGEDSATGLTPVGPLLILRRDKTRLEIFQGDSPLDRTSYPSFPDWCKAYSREIVFLPQGLIYFHDSEKRTHVPPLVLQHVITASSNLCRHPHLNASAYQDFLVDCKQAFQEQLKWQAAFEKEQSIVSQIANFEAAFADLKNKTSAATTEAELASLAAQLCKTRDHIAGDASLMIWVTKRRLVRLLRQMTAYNESISTRSLILSLGLALKKCRIDLATNPNNTALMLRAGMELLELQRRASLSRSTCPSHIIHLKSIVTSINDVARNVSQVYFEQTGIELHHAAAKEMQTIMSTSTQHHQGNLFRRHVTDEIQNQLDQKPGSIACRIETRELRPPFRQKRFPVHVSAAFGSPVSYVVYICLQFTHTTTHDGVIAHHFAISYDVTPTKRLVLRNDG
jgi:hypothetical protein